MNDHLKQLSDLVWEIPPTGGMRVPGRVYADQGLMDALRGDQSLTQVANVAHLPGILFASRLQSATTTAGTLFELDAIAAAYIGGVSAAGGVGKVTGSFIGALVYISLMNGMALLGTDISLQYVVRGAVLAIAVIFDVTTRRTRK